MSVFTSLDKDCLERHQLRGMSSGRDVAVTAHGCSIHLGVGMPENTCSSVY